MLGQCVSASTLVFDDRAVRNLLEFTLLGSVGQLGGFVQTGSIDPKA